MIIALLNQKGGVGKTTLAIHIAMGLAKNKKKVLLVDSDTQASALDWSAARENETPFSVVGIPKPTLHKELRKLEEDYEFIIVDGAPRLYDVARSAIAASDLVIIPVQPSPYDVWSAKEIVDLVNKAKDFEENLKAVFLLNRKIVNTAIGRDVKEALSEYKLPILKSEICQRVGFAESAGSGQTVLETDPDGLASKEIRKLVKEILEVGK